jgi:hypothetical protein
MHIIEPTLQQMSSVAKPQRKFIFILLTALTYLPGRVNFRNLGHYTPLSEKTFSRWFRRPFNFVAFNLLSLNALLDNGEWVAAIDASFHPKVDTAATVWTGFGTVHGEPGTLLAGLSGGDAQHSLYPVGLPTPRVAQGP